jgi:hypothetical protein
MGKTLRWVIPGSRLLATDRAAMLRSGSPPGLGHATPGALPEDDEESDSTEFAEVLPYIAPLFALPPAQSRPRYLSGRRPGGGGSEAALHQSPITSALLRG